MHQETIFCEQTPAKFGTGKTEQYGMLNKLSGGRGIRSFWQ
jgi:hypothetical protein